MNAPLPRKNFINGALSVRGKFLGYNQRTVTRILEICADELFDVLRHDLSIIVDDAEEIEVENCDGCANEMEDYLLVEDENAGLKFCSTCTEENRLGLKTEAEVSA